MCLHQVPAEHKDSLKDNLQNAMKWIEANFSSLQVTRGLVGIPLPYSSYSRMLV